MNMTVGCSLGYEVLSPTANFTINVLVNKDPHQEIRAEQLTCVPEAPREVSCTAKGNRVVHLEAGAGPFEIRYQAVVDSHQPSLPEEVKPDLPGPVPAGGPDVHAAQPGTANRIDLPRSPMSFLVTS